MNNAAAKLTRAAAIAALYAALTLLFSFSSYGLIQIRVSEAMCVLPLYTASAVPGLFIGCVIANLIGGMGIWDIVIGGLATLLSAVLTRSLRKVKFARFLAPLPCVVINALAIGAMMAYIFELPEGFLLCAAYVGAGQTIACLGLGIPLTYALDRFGFPRDDVAPRED